MPHSLWSPAGHPIAGDIADVPLKQGDVLIVEAGPEFQANFKNNRAFSLISEVPKSSPMKRNKMYIALFLTVAMVTTQVRKYVCIHPSTLTWLPAVAASCDDC